MIRREHQFDEHDAELWGAFLDHYSATETRDAVDVFLRAIVGAPAKEVRP